ncbi:MAG TPA: hypothetical protein VGL89_16930 [Candidatus Koribacter sp.]|jgi:hypothetical protein
MPTKKSTRKTSTKHSNHLNGSYLTPKRNVSIAVPPFWFFRQTNDDMELDSPTTATSIVVSAFHRTARREPLDSREYMQRFLQTAPAAGRKTVTVSTKSRTVAKFRDGEGANWQCAFLTDGNTLLLATLNSTEKPSSGELQTGLTVLDSIRIVKK